MINEIISKIRALQPSAVIAIDGRCASGKTSLALTLQKALSCNVVHMDDFFLRSEQRTESRLKEPGGNTDYERFLEEVLQPLAQGKTVTYRPYICHTQSFGASITLPYNNITIVEGSYSCHPELYNFYDLRIFLDINSDEQMNRILQRNGKDNAEQFKKLWIPLEELYFTTFKIKQNCNLIYKS